MMESNHPIAFRASEETRRQLAALSERWGENMSQTITRAIERCFQLEEERMMAEQTKVRITKVNTKPELDPYHRDTNQATRTVIALDCQTGELSVDQEYDDNSTPMYRWHGHERTWRVWGHPQEDDMRTCLEDELDVYQRIVDGYESVWDGSNHVGRYTEDALAAYDTIERNLEYFDLEYFDPTAGYNFCSPSEWLGPALHEILPDAQAADDLEAYALQLENETRAENIVLSGTVLEWLQDELKDYEPETASG